MRRKHYSERRYREAKKRLKGLPCIYCGTPSDTVEHRIPLALGGTNNVDNLAPACRSCNSRLGQALGAKRRKAARVQRGSRW